MMRIMFATIVFLLSPAPGHGANCQDNPESEKAPQKAACRPLETVSIFGVAQDSRDVAGGASEISQEQLQAFATTDVVRALRRVPGASLQAEDGFGLRPNISIRGTPSERSSRITLLEDNVLIAPAPYAAPSAYYFPTFGRIHGVEVLKGPAGISQGPYTVGGALNLVSTPVPDSRSGRVSLEAGSDDTWRAHAWFGDSGTRASWMVETHQWQSDGYQDIDRSDSATGLDKSDYLAKMSFRSDPAAAIYQEFNIKLQTSDEISQQSYLGLTDVDFHRQPLRRYGASALDTMDSGHDQVVLNWRVEPSDQLALFVTAYNNESQRAWYKTEGLDADGSDSPDDFQRTSWASIVSAINMEASAAGLDAGSLQAILDGADTAPGSIQLRNNSRDYYSRGVQGGGLLSLEGKRASHELKFGVRLHEDQEDRLQRNDTYQQAGGLLVLNAIGMEGNAGNRVQQAEAFSFFVQDRIELGDWALSPGLRYENVRQQRFNYGADPDNPTARSASGLVSERGNREDFWIPGMGVMYQANEHWTVLGGVHRGFSAPGDRDGVDAELSINYEAGFRYQHGSTALDVIAFFHDYENLQGICTASSGRNCEIGDAFNGDAVSVPGLELLFNHDFATGQRWSIPLSVSYTWMDAEFETDIADSAFFGDVTAGDPVPYIPDHQLFASIGFSLGPWSAHLSGSYVDAVCTVATCGAFERTESSTTFDLGVQYRTGSNIEWYAAVENLTSELSIAGRQPYGARPGKDRSWLLGARIRF
ncbi:MAG: TonB-dependent receptor [Xanthomonadales bacterium]|nr:TonB-dependent receptor [Xanthomonadales bacterium]